MYILCGNLALAKLLLVWPSCSNKKQTSLSSSTKKCEAEFIGVRLSLHFVPFESHANRTNSQVFRPVPSRLAFYVLLSKRLLPRRFPSINSFLSNSWITPAMWTHSYTHTYTSDGRAYSVPVSLRTVKPYKSSVPLCLSHSLRNHLSTLSTGNAVATQSEPSATCFAIYMGTHTHPYSAPTALKPVTATAEVSPFFPACHIRATQKCLCAPGNLTCCGWLMRQKVFKPMWAILRGRAIACMVLHRSRLIRRGKSRKRAWKSCDKRVAHPQLTASRHCTAFSTVMRILRVENKTSPCFVEMGSGEASTTISRRGVRSKLLTSALRPNSKWEGRLNVTL